MTNKMLTSAITAVISLGVAQTSLAGEMTPGMGSDVQGMEKCYGIVKAGQNDCGTANHTCSGEAKVSGSKTEWLYLPTGLCNRIVGGSKTSGTSESK